MKLTNVLQVFILVEGLADVACHDVGRQVLRSRAAWGAAAMPAPPAVDDDNNNDGD